MARWEQVVAEVPEFAAAVQALFDAHTHKTLATLRKDGSPRICGIEASFRRGDLWFGSMWQARKAQDLRRDPRFALHSASVDAAQWKGDARISGRAEEITDPAVAEAVAAEDEDAPPPEPSHLYRADITEVVHVQLGGDPPDHIVIESWKEGQGLRRIERR